jgi:hypothetical protein
MCRITNRHNLIVVIPKPYQVLSKILGDKNKLGIYDFILNTNV